MSPQRPALSSEGRRIVICDYNALLLWVTGLLRMSRYCVFQVHDGRAAEERCKRMPEIALLVVNTYGTGIDVGDLVSAGPRGQSRDSGPAYRLGSSRRAA